jgi:hypothetical protein
LNYEHARLAAHWPQISPHEHGSLQSSQEDEAGVEAGARAPEGLTEPEKIVKPEHEFATRMK